MNVLYLQAAGHDSDNWRTIAIVRELDGQQELKKYQKHAPELRWRLATEDQVSNRTAADWSISLDVTCPYCNEIFDETADEWPEGIQPGEHGTERTTDYETTCPGCDRDLLLVFQC